jgi:hypothetical protein
MRTLPLLLLSAFALAPTAKADKFWLESPDTKPAVDGSLPAVIEGVLVGEDDRDYHIRLVGGQISLAKKLVVKVEKDQLTVDAIAKLESDQALALAAADSERQTAQRAARESREAMRQPVEAAMRNEPQPAAVMPEPVYDPVVGALSGVSAAGAMFELERAYELTGDRAYIKALRQLRRMN